MFLFLNTYAISQFEFFLGIILKLTVGLTHFSNGILMLMFPLEMLVEYAGKGLPSGIYQNTTSSSNYKAFIFT